MGSPEESVQHHDAPQGEPLGAPPQLTEPSRAVFLSYASQDAGAARKICEALRAAGIDVWFDQSELRGGDTWDQSIRRHIKTCALFIPVISKHTHARDEGYFRLEWKLAVDRSHLISANRAFLLPVVVDATRDDDENVPDRFRDVQWTRLPGGETPPAFVERIKRVLSPEPPTPARSPTDAASGSSPIPVAKGRPSPWGRALPVAVAVLVVAALAYALISKPWSSKPAGTSTTSNATSSPAAPATAFNPPPHSIAVLPFVNMSGDKEQEYFSDGLSEELLNDLARINELQVAGRTSSFYFKGKDVELGTIARKLNVGAVLEGSVRRSAHTVRITAQLINAVTGFHMWSQTYDRGLGDVLKLQTEIAESVAGALKATLLGNVGTKIAVGGTRDPAAYDAYLRASNGYWHQRSASELEKVIADYAEAVRLDPNFALAHAEHSIAISNYAESYATEPSVRDWIGRARASALKAIALAPDLAEGHMAFADVLSDSIDFTRASEEYERAVALAPGSARALKNYGHFAVLMGHTEAGLAASRHAVALDPLSVTNHTFLIDALYYARRYDEMLAACHDALSLAPNEFAVRSAPLGAYYGLGDFQNVRSLGERLEEEAVKERNEMANVQAYLAAAYRKLGRRVDAETAMNGLFKMLGANSGAGAWVYAQVYAQWGDTSKALDSLEMAARLRAPYLEALKTEPFFDPLRNEPRFQAIERELKFPP